MKYNPRKITESNGHYRTTYIECEVLWGLYTFWKKVNTEMVFETNYLLGNIINEIGGKIEISDWNLMNRYEVTATYLPEKLSSVFESKKIS